MSSDPGSAIWPPLVSSKSEIRLLRLSRVDGRLSGSFEIRSLSHHPRYDAISHAWGRPSSSATFFVDHEGEKQILIPRSLWDLLNQLRSSGAHSTTLFWVDAIWYASRTAVENQTLIIVALLRMMSRKGPSK